MIMYGRNLDVRENVTLCAARLRTWGDRQCTRARPKGETLCPQHRKLHDRFYPVCCRSIGTLTRAER